MTRSGGSRQGLLRWGQYRHGMPMSDVDEHDDDVVPASTDLGPATRRIDDVDPTEPAPGRRPFDWKLWIACLPIAVGRRC